MHCRHKDNKAAWYYTVSQKKTVPTYFFAPFLSNMKQFEQKLEGLSRKKPLRNCALIATSPKVCACTTLGNLKCQIEPSTQ